MSECQPASPGRRGGGRICFCHARSTLEILSRCICPSSDLITGSFSSDRLRRFALRRWLLAIKGANFPVLVRGKVVKGVRSGKHKKEAEQEK